MTGLDWGIVALALALALWGYRQGFIIGAASFLGFAVGAFAGGRLAPLILPDGSASPYAPIAALSGAMLVGGIFATVLEVFAFRVRDLLVRGPRIAVVDGLGGASLLGALALGFAWMAGTVVLNAPIDSQLRRDVQRSEILSRLYGSFPPSGPLIKALNRIDPLPDLSGPPPRVGPPSQASIGSAGVRASAASVVRVTGHACGLGIEGSGWVAAPGVVVTNAHVVAGQDDTVVQAGGTGAQLDASPVHFDPHNDLAVLRVRGLDLPALRLADAPAAGASGAILGYPQNGPYDVRPARLGATERVISQDSYGRGPIERRMTAIRGLIRDGNSGGPVVSEKGEVLATVFASATNTRKPGGFGVPDEIVSAALGSLGRAVSTGPCTR